MKALLAVVLVVAAILCDDSCAQKINPRNSLHDCVADNCLFRDVCLSSDRGLTYYKHPIEILGYADIDSNYPRRSPLLFNVNPEPPSLQCEPIRLSMSENTHIECSTCIAQAPATDVALRQQAVSRFDSKSYSFTLPHPQMAALLPLIRTLIGRLSASIMFGYNQTPSLQYPSQSCQALECHPQLRIRLRYTFLHSHSPHTRPRPGPAFDPNPYHNCDLHHKC